MWLSVAYSNMCLHYIVYCIQVPLNEYDFSIKKLYNIQSQVSFCAWEGFLIPIIMLQVSSQ